MGLYAGRDVAQIQGISIGGTFVFNGSIGWSRLLQFFETLQNCLVNVEAFTRPGMRFVAHKALWIIWVALTRNEPYCLRATI